MTGFAGQPLVYWRSGSGAPVVLLHGLAADHCGLLPMARHWGGLDVIAPDLPGFGHSPPCPGRHTLTGYADAVEELCDRLDLTGVTVVGHSLGATIALVCAARHPDRLRAAVLLSPVSTFTGPAAWGARAYYGFGSLLPERAARWWYLSRPIVYLSDSSSLVTRDRTVRRRIRREDHRTAALADPGAVADIYRSFRDTDLATVAAGTAVPALVVGAERDRLAPPDAVRALGRQLPRAGTVIVPGAGHLWVAEEPAAAAALVARSLPGLARAA